MPRIDVMMLEVSERGCLCSLPTSLTDQLLYFLTLKYSSRGKLVCDTKICVMRDRVSRCRQCARPDLFMAKILVLHRIMIILIF